MSETRIDTPRSLHLLARISGGGTETNIRRLCESTPQFEWVALEEFLGWPFRWHRLFWTIGRLRTHRPDVVFCYGISSHIVAMLTWPIGKPLVGSIRCESDFAGWKGVLRQMIRWRFSEWVSNSAAALHNEKGVVIYNGVLKPGKEEPLFHGLRKPVYAVLAREHPKKGHLYALRLWRKLGKPGTLIFAGDLSPTLKQRAENLGIICPGFIDSGRLLRCIDMLWIPSSAEGVPTVLLEAMARGVPCLATPVGGVEEIVEHKRHAYVLPRREWLRFLRAVDWTEARTIGERSRQLVLKKYTMEQMREQFAAVAKRVVEGATR